MDWLMLILHILGWVVFMMVFGRVLFNLIDDSMFSSRAAAWVKLNTIYRFERKWNWKRFNYCYHIYKANDLDGFVLLVLKDFEFIRWAMSLGFPNPYGDEFSKYRYEMHINNVFEDLD